MFKDRYILDLEGGEEGARLEARRKPRRMLLSQRGAGGEARGSPVLPASTSKQPGGTAGEGTCRGGGTSGVKHRTATPARPEVPLLPWL